MSLRSWLRDVVGPDPDDLALIDSLEREVLALEAEVEAAERRVEVVERELSAAHVDLVAARANVSALDRKLMAVLGPGDDPGCQKVRLRDRDEATEFARKAEGDLALDVGSLEPYRCPVCPRHPLTATRYWHVRNVDREGNTAHRHAGVKTLAGGIAAHRRGERKRQNGGDLAERLGPAVVAKLQERTGEAS